MGTCELGVKSVTRTTQQSVFALLCAIALFQPLSLRAGALEDFTSSVSRSVSDAASKGVDAVSQKVGSAISGTSQPSASSSPVPQSTLHPPTPLSLPLNQPGSADCLSVRPEGADRAWMTNSCASDIVVLLAANGGSTGCLKFDVQAQKSRTVAFGKKGVVRAVCPSRKGLTTGVCNCAVGN